ncbi:MAG TPA: TetR/AcrR family transcriptional regulator [Opitutaceae bacterium]|jgi:AcrR family transcriptional regulator
MRSKNESTGPKRTFIEEARRNQIIEATIAVVAEEGYAGAALGRVAQRAQISKSVVVYHFGGKDELVEATVQQIYEEIGGAVGPRVKAAANSRERLRTYIESQFAFLEMHRDRLLTVSYLLMNHRDREGSLYLHDRAERINLEMIGAMLEAGQKSGEFRAFAVKPMAATLMHSIHGALGQWVMDPKLSLPEYARELVTIFELATQRLPPTGGARRT